MVQIEQYGVESIPEQERTSSPSDIISILVGSNLCLGVVIFGWLPVSFGLGFWAAASSLIVGTLIGAILTAPLALISFKSATNLSTSSGAAFGVRGRLIGSLIGLLLALGYTSLTLWVGGAIMVEVLDRMGWLLKSNVLYSISYGCLAAFTAIGAVYGYRCLLSTSKFLMGAMIFLLCLGCMAYAPNFVAEAEAPYLLETFWETWLLAVVSAGLSGPIAFITLLGDYSRYISPLRHTDRSVFNASYLGLILGILIPQLFGVYVAVATKATSDFAGPLVFHAPTWYLIPLLIIATLGTIGNSGVMLYSMGLDLDAIVPCLTRKWATLLMACIATLLVFLGHFVWEAQDAITSFVLMLTAIGTPWAVIILIDYFNCKGIYDCEALQIYNRGARGGAYWFYGGWNREATLAWLVGAVIGLVSVLTPLYQGPLVPFMGEMDLSFILSGLGAGIVYTTVSRYKCGIKIEAKI